MSHLMRLALFFSISMAANMAHAGVYQWVDDEGRVHYSDQASTGAKAVKLKDHTHLQLEVAATVAEVAQFENAAIAEYQVRILKPEPEATLRNNNCNIKVEVWVQPRLTKGHELQLLLNGEPQVSLKHQGQFELANVDRGEHSLRVRVIDRQQKPLASSPAVTIFLHRARIRP